MWLCFTPVNLILFTSACRALLLMLIQTDLFHMGMQSSIAYAGPNWSSSHRYAELYCLCWYKLIFCTFLYIAIFPNLCLYCLYLFKLTFLHIYIHSYFLYFLCIALLFMLEQTDLLHICIHSAIVYAGTNRCSPMYMADWHAPSLSNILCKLHRFIHINTAWIWFKVSKI